ncbi:MAG: cupin domain-containing protein, partial [Tetragenococcus halophilus]|nr:cupin domain-containing protein [Tetragenococcus halophilus]MDN6164461.1 cupin domain-containing protein [Tetragenococcus halophilus]MDN6257893.1 cupin domain-containing protein [Tetragenococcus halophilus]MDN6265781.1 cupin domain-containing protein [Tetragenococcus halophilus]MDN6504607.1 cupin domain-containing protein [Tetragenococcus halophilus]
DILGKAGDAQLIEKNEGHINYNDSNEPAVVVWFLVERKEEK